MKNTLILLAVLLVIAIISFTLLLPYFTPEPEPEVVESDVPVEFAIPPLSEEDLTRLGPENSLEGIQWLQPNGLYGVIVHPQRLLGSQLVANGKDILSMDLANLSMIPLNFEKVNLVLMNTAIRQVVIPPQPGGNPAPQIAPLPYVSYYIKLQEPVDKQMILTAFVPPNSGFPVPKSTRKVQEKDVYDLPAAYPRETHALVFLDETTFIYALADEIVLNQILDGKPSEDPLTQRMKRVPEHDLENSDMIIVASAEAGIPKLPPEVIKNFALDNGLPETLVSSVVENFRALRISINLSAEEGSDAFSLLYESLKEDGAKAISKILIEQTVFLRSTLSLANAASTPGEETKTPESQAANALAAVPGAGGLLKEAAQYGNEALDALHVSWENVNVAISLKRFASLPELAAYYFQNRKDTQARVQEQAAMEREMQAIVQRMNTIRQYTLAYHNENQHFPPAAIRDANGQPLLSWRVALLPYMGEKELYAQFKLDEPWDSENNKPLINRMPMIFADPRGFDPTRSTIRLYNFEGTPFANPDLKMSSVDQRNTLMFVAVLPENAVEWTRPEFLSKEQTFEEIQQRFGDYLPLMLFSGNVLLMQPKNIIESEKPLFMKRMEGLILGKPMEP